MTRDTGRRVAEIKVEMERKTNDASRDAASKRWKMNKWRKEVESNECYDRNKVQKMIKRMKAEANMEREQIREKNSKAIGFKNKNIVMSVQIVLNQPLLMHQIP